LQGKREARIFEDHVGGLVQKFLEGYWLSMVAGSCVLPVR
jgi:hypothetical protein